MIKEKIIVIYHGNCLDGFGGAYAAWKKFGNEVAYFPVHDRDKLGLDVSGKEVYLIDFSYSKESLLQIEKKAKRLVVLDHHFGVKEAVESVREHIFDLNNSGAGIAWNYFHAGKPLPKLLAYIQEQDIWRFALPNTKDVSAYLSTIPFDFDFWDKLAGEFEDEKKFNVYLERGRGYNEYFGYVCKNLAEQAELVEFEGYKVLAVQAPRLFRSELGNMLALKNPPFSIVWYRNAGKWHFSLRGDGSIDLTKIAEKYGSSGHKNAAAIRLPFDAPLPFKFV